MFRMKISHTLAESSEVYLSASPRSFNPLLKRMQSFVTTVALPRQRDAMARVEQTRCEFIYPRNIGWPHVYAGFQVASD